MYGDRLLELCLSAKGRLLLVAPFVKASVLERLLGRLDPNLSVDCVTRWWPQEIISGVSDLEIWAQFREQGERRRLFLRQDLHAKYFRADDRALVGSVNLTGKALGYVEPANFELLIELSAATKELHAFEEDLWRATIIVDEGVYQSMADLVLALPSPAGGKLAAEHFMHGPIASADLATWVPRTRNPEVLYMAYRSDRDALSRAATEAAVADLAVLNVPTGLADEQYTLAVRTLLLQTPVASVVDRFVATERRFGEVTQLLATITGPAGASNEWQTLMRWFRHFAPDRYRYRRPGHSELIRRMLPADSE